MTKKIFCTVKHSPSLTQAMVGFVLLLFIFGGNSAIADITLQEVTAEAGITHRGKTWGASWGDFNSDGWPDLWVGNHNSKPCLYLNQADGTFTDVIDEVWDADPLADTHGAAWADFDNDGDQDLIEVVGSVFSEEGDVCLGCGQNHLFVNEGGKLREQAQGLGLAQPVAASRTPLWVDVDRDGRLDVITSTTRGFGKKPGTLLYRQTSNGFELFNEPSGFADSHRTRGEKLGGLASNLFHFRFHWPEDMTATNHQEFPQLADLSGNGKPDVILYARPTRVYAIDQIPLKDISPELGFPAVSGITDSAVGDFDGNSQLDLYLTVGRVAQSEVVQVGPRELRGNVLGRTRGVESEDFKSVSFQSRGDIHVSIYPVWLKLSEILIGPEGRNPSSRSFKLTPGDPSVAGRPAPEVLQQGKAAMYHQPETGTWTIVSCNKHNFVDFIVTSNQDIDTVTLSGFTHFQEEGVDALLMRRDGRFVNDISPSGLDFPTSCHSVVSGDFDNDMDEDLYLVCSGSVQNLPNRLYENLGEGRFAVVPEAGGASGSRLGRGDVVATADYDRDGFLDLFITNGRDPASPFAADGPHQLFRNSGNDNHWLQIDLTGVTSNRDGIGARVAVFAGGKRQTREQAGGIHRMAQNHQRVHFGLGKYEKVDKLVITWPSGKVQTLTDIEANQILEVEENT